MVFFTPRHSHFTFQNFISLPACAPFNLLKSLLICVILLLGSTGNINSATKTENLSSFVRISVTNRIASTMSATGIYRIISPLRDNVNTTPTYIISKGIDSLEFRTALKIADICVLNSKSILGNFTCIGDVTFETKGSINCSDSYFKATQATLHTSSTAGFKTDKSKVNIQEIKTSIYFYMCQL